MKIIQVKVERESAAYEILLGHEANILLARKLWARKHTIKHTLKNLRLRHSFDIPVNSTHVHQEIYTSLSTNKPKLPGFITVRADSINVFYT